MSALIIVDFTTQDNEQLTQYGAAASTLLSRFGGEYLSKGGIEPLFGNSTFETKVVIQLPDREAALAWYYSPEYQELLPVRGKAMNCQFHLVG